MEAHADLSPMSVIVFCSYKHIPGVHNPADCASSVAEVQTQAVTKIALTKTETELEHLSF